MKAGPERELIARYQKRCRASGNNLGFTGPEIFEIPESRASSPDQRKNDETSKLLAAVPDGAFVIALDENGKNLSSKEFSSQLLQTQQNGHRSLAILIGGADGHGKKIAEIADITLSFGRLTWPHQLVRLLLVEQLYRAMTILSGHPYHRQ